MAFSNSNDYLTGRKQTPIPRGQEVVHARFPLAMAAADLALNTIGAVGILPAGCIPVEVRVAGTDFEGGAAAGVYSIGIWDGSSANLSTAADDGGAAWGDSGAAVAIAFDKALTRTPNVLQAVKATNADRTIGMKVTTAPSATIAAGTLWLDVWYRVGQLGAAG